MINVLAVCKNSVFMRGVESHLLAHGIKLLSVCNSSHLGAEQYRAYKPDLVIMDANWTGLTHKFSGLELLLSLLLEDAQARIIIMTNVHEPELVKSFRKEGVKGYIYRNSRHTLQELIDCINTVYQGGECFED